MKASPILLLKYVGVALARQKRKYSLSLLGELLKLEDLPGPLLVDNMEDEVQFKFRFYLLTKILVHFVLQITINARPRKAMGPSLTDFMSSWMA